MIRSKSTRLSLIISVIISTYFIATSPVSAQFSQHNHPELAWKTIETEHFAVHFHEGTERTAREIAGIAELVYEPITRLYDYEPDGKIHWVIRDHDDYSNGAAYYYDQKIIIWATALDFELRSTHHWLYDVVTHEFTHMIQLGAARKAPRWLPAVYFQFIGYEEEKRPDVLYGYPNRILSWPWAGTVIPMWFAEGTAQYQVSGLDHDWWDTHRDMILRTRALDGKLLTFSQMGVFGKTSYGSESVYNHGYALVRYISDNWGEKSLSDLTNDMSRLDRITFNGACKKVLGISADELYQRWSTDITDEYSDRTVIIRENTRSGEILCDKGFANLYPKFLPDGKTIAFMSNKGADYISLSKLYFYDTESDSLIDTESKAKGPVSASPDGEYLAYSSKSGPNRQGSHFNDLYLWNIANEKTIRLTKDARLKSPSFSTDGKKIICVHNQGGTHNLALVELPDDLDKKDISATVEWRRLTEFNDGRQIYNPIFGPNNEWIYYATSNIRTRDIYRYNLQTGLSEPVVATDADERDVTFRADGTAMYWCDDRTGIFNIYRRNPETGIEEVVTNVLGGAFMPDINQDGHVAYSEFTSDGYSLRILKDVQPVESHLTTYRHVGQLQHSNLVPPPTIDTETEDYASPFGGLFIYPRIAWDYDRFKPGIYFFTSDILEKLSLFGGVARNGINDGDLYGQIEYRMLKPTLSIEVFNITRNRSERFEDQFVIVGKKYVLENDGDSVAVPIFGTYGADYRFNLVELNAGARIPVATDFTASATFRYSRYKSSIRFEDGGSFDYTYFLGRALLLRLSSDQRALTVANDIHPQGGWRGWIEYSLEQNRFIEGFEIEAEKGTIVEVYTPYNYHRVETDLDYYRKLFGNVTINPRLIAGVISRSVDPFFHLYAGGLIGLRGYSFYSIGGTNKAVGRLAIRSPLLTGIDRKWGPFYLDRVHVALFAEIGDAWTGGLDNLSLKRDVGAALRFKLFSWYGFPTDLQFTGAYGLDRFNITDDRGGLQEYGRSWQWFMTLLFDFI